MPKFLGVTVEIRKQKDGDEWLYLRGTFPPKPGSGKTKPYQQRISLNSRNTPAAMRRAIATARIVAGELNLGLFDWRKWDKDEPASVNKSVGDWVNEFEIYWWKIHDKNNSSHRNNWRCNYEFPLKSLPRNVELTVPLLVDWITANSDPADSVRKNYVTCGKKLAQFADLPIEPIAALKGDYSIKPINPRLLPSDEDIVKLHDSVADGWKWAVGMLAAYGLRPHEVWLADLSEFPLIRVQSNAKTGARVVHPLYPEWAERWNLSQRILPAKLKLSEDDSNQQLGRKITHFFNSSVGYSAYNLRHSYARRCKLLGIDLDDAARLMGHSPEIHRKVYRAWIGEEVLIKSVDRALSRPDRPMAP